MYNGIPSHYSSALFQKSGNVSSSTCGFLSSTNIVYISFTSGSTSSNNYPGFRASLTTDNGRAKTVPAVFSKIELVFWRPIYFIISLLLPFLLGCSGVFNNSNQGVIQTPGFQINGSIYYSSCSWTIRVGVGSKINLTMTNVDGPLTYVQVFASF